jgi:hypothetical protein
MMEPDGQAEDGEEEFKAYSQKPTLKHSSGSSEANLHNSGAKN